MLFVPSSPGRVSGGYLWQPALEILSLDTHESLLVWIPEGPCLPVVQDKGVPVGPPGGYERQLLTVYFAAVHSRQVDEGSVRHRNFFRTPFAVRDLMTAQAPHRIGFPGFSVVDADNAHIPGDILVPFGEMGIVKGRKSVFPDAVLKPTRVETERHCLRHIPSLAGHVDDVGFITIL